MISRYTTVVGRTRKPFNSLLGETFELVTSQYRFVSEQVSHHPPITAFHCESANYEVHASSSTTLKFNGRYAIFSPKDLVHINLRLVNGDLEIYSATLPDVSVHNLVLGKMYIEVSGKCQVKNETTGDVCEMDY